MSRGFWLTIAGPPEVFKVHSQVWMAGYGSRILRLEFQCLFMQLVGVIDINARSTTTLTIRVYWA